ncbi:hypothetical protein PMAYCL1PPCAC_13341, partial [Pristionchus mayeri]
LQQLQQMHMQQMQMQHMQHQQRLQQQSHFQMALVIAEDGSQHMVPYSQLLMHQQQQQQEQEGLLKLSAPPPPHGASPPHHMMVPGMGGVLAPPPQGQMTSSSIFPAGHVIVEHGNGSHLVPANMSVESVISNSSSIKKRQRMAPQRHKDVADLMKKRGIVKGANLDDRKDGRKMQGLPIPLGLSNLPGIVSIRMPPGCNPAMMSEQTDLPIEAITIDGRSHPTTIRELPALSKAVSSRAAAAASAVSARPPPSMLTPEERIAETISTVRSKAADEYEMLQAERRGSDASVASANDAAPVLAPGADEEPSSPPPLLEAPETPDTPRSLEIDESMDDSPAPPPPPMQRIPA